MIRNLAILGGMGDLTGRFLVPALVRLHQAGKLPDDLQVVGVSRKELDTAGYRRHMAGLLERFAADIEPAARESLLARLEHRRADTARRDEMTRALEGLNGPIVVYLALPPTIYAPTIETLGKIGLPEGSLVVVEKPFGEGLESAQHLNRLLHEHFPEQAVFRVDHFLQMQTVQTVLGLRFANRVFGHLWSREHIERVEIIWDETIALEGRAGYYDTAGAVRDMIQNHLFQLLCLAAMEAPVTLSERDLRDRKVDVLRAVRRLTPEEIERHTYRARYAAGRVGDRDIPAYVDEQGIDPARETETFAQVTLFIDNWRWAGVPFVLRSGKALPKDRRELVVHFRPVPHLAFEKGNPVPNVLRLQLLNPDRLSLTIDVNGPGDLFTLERLELAAELVPQELTAYGHLLLDLLRGDATLSIRDDEAEEAWRIIDPILEAWHAGRTPLHEYPAGTLPDVPT